MINKIIFFSCVCFILNCSCTIFKKEIKIVLVQRDTSSTISDFDTSRLLYALETYIIQNYRDNKETEKKIETFVQSWKDSSFIKYNQYTISFLKETKEESLEKMVANKKYLNKYIIPTNVDYVA
jgi:hypothetical protein